MGDILKKKKISDELRSISIEDILGATLVAVVLVTFVGVIKPVLFGLQNYEFSSSLDYISLVKFGFFKYLFILLVTILVAFVAKLLLRKKWSFKLSKLTLLFGVLVAMGVYAIIPSPEIQLSSSLLSPFNEFLNKDSDDFNERIESLKVGESVEYATIKNKPNVENAVMVKGKEENIYTLINLNNSFCGKKIEYFYQSRILCGGTDNKTPILEAFKNQTYLAIREFCISSKEKCEEGGHDYLAEIEEKKTRYTLGLIPAYVFGCKYVVGFDFTLDDLKEVQCEKLDVCI